MATKSLRSPGFISVEQDLSTVPARTLGRSVGLVGRSQRGKAFIPTVATTWDEFTSQFGNQDVNMHAPYAAYYYFKKASPVTFVRTLGIDTSSTDGTARHAGFTASYAYAIGVSGSDGVGKIAGVLHTTLPLVACSGTSAKSFLVQFGDYSTGTNFTCSLYRGDKNYIGKVLNTDPTAYPATTQILNGVTSKKHYWFRDFTYDSTVYNGTIVTASLITNGATYQTGYTHAKTPWITSQNYGSALTPLSYSLFQVHALSDGEYENTNIKVSISNIRNSVNTASTEYGTFDLYVRDYEDTDRVPVYFEKFTDLTMDPNSKNYVARRIGDMSATWNTVTEKIDVTGDYPNKSAFIRVSMNSDFVAGQVPKDSVPWGYDASIPRIAGGALLTSSIYSASNLPVVFTQTWKGEYSDKVHWGFSNVNSASGINWYCDDRLQYIPSGLSVNYDPVFSLTYLSSSTGTSGSFASGTYSGIIYYNTGSLASPISQSNVAGTSLAKFTVPLFGGFDGLNIHYVDPFDNYKMVDFATANFGSSTDWAKSYEVTSLKEGIDTLSNQDVVDLKDLAIPSIYHPGVISHAINMVEDRTDCFLVCDISGTTVSNAKTWRENVFTYDTSYAAAYFPRLKIYDSYNDKYVWVYPSTLVMSVIGNTDTISYPWFAPAGMNRGDLSSDVVQLECETNQEDRNELYDRQINPIAKLEGSIVVWGQKTLQMKASSLDRVNVRRMLLHIKKSFASYSKVLNFENINSALFDRFKSLADPFLARIVQNNGLNGYTLVVDESNNTKETKERNEINVKLILEPTMSAERWVFTLVVTRQGTFGA